MTRRFPTIAAALGALLAVACADSEGTADAFFTSDADAMTTTTSDVPLFDDVTNATDAATTPTDATATTTADTTAPPDTSVPTDTVVGPAPIVSASCLDGQYDETLPNPDGDISALVAAYAPAGAKTFIDGALGVRYPIGQYLVAGGQQATSFGDCITIFLGGQTGNANQVMRQLSTIVHECGHFFDIDESTFSGNTYVFRPDYRETCAQGDTTTRGGRTFARSLLNDDPYAATNPNDFYRDVYLDGDPNDGTFDSGDQGFNSVIEEAVQYVNSLATDYAFADAFGNLGISSRDGILTFLWYIERYLQLAREQHPDAYAFLLGDACWRRTILTVWGRAWLYLDLTEDDDRLGLDDDFLIELVTAPDLLGEIQRVRIAHGCP